MSDVDEAWARGICGEGEWSASCQLTYGTGLRSNAWRVFVSFVSTTTRLDRSGTVRERCQGVAHQCFLNRLATAQTRGNGEWRALELMCCMANPDVWRAKDKVRRMAKGGEAGSAECVARGVRLGREAEKHVGRASWGRERAQKGCGPVRKEGTGWGS